MIDFESMLFQNRSSKLICFLLNYNVPLHFKDGQEKPMMSNATWESGYLISKSQLKNDFVSFLKEFFRKLYLLLVFIHVPFFNQYKIPKSFDI